MHTKTILAGIIALTLSGGAWAAGTSEQSETQKEPAASTEAQQAPTGTQPSTSQAVESYEVRVSNLTGKTVRNPQDEEIGEVDDLVITQDGQVYAILSVGGFLGLGERLVAVPYDELQPGPEGEDYLTYTATKEELEQKPEFQYEQGEAGWGMKKEGEEKMKEEKEMQEGTQKEKQ